MSSTIWTHIAVASEAAQVRFDLWRAVEAQHAVATMVLADTLDEQELLERLLETSKPPLPRGCDGLHWLLFTPFRYPPPPSGSRFRGPLDPGVFYGADEVRTACAELGYWRWHFLMACPGLATLDPRQQTVFQVSVDCLAVDLRQPPFAVDREQWTSPANYKATQTFAQVAREGDIGAIRYESIRDPEKSGCGAVLTPNAFADASPKAPQSWWLSVTRERVIWQRDDVLQKSSWEFDAQAFTRP